MQSIVKANLFFRILAILVGVQIKTAAKTILVAVQQNSDLSLTSITPASSQPQMSARNAPQL